MAKAAIFLRKSRLQRLVPRNHLAITPITRLGKACGVPISCAVMKPPRTPLFGIPDVVIHRADESVVKVHPNYGADLTPFLVPRISS